MNRHYDTAGYLPTILHLRETIPGVMFTTDLKEGWYTGLADTYLRVNFLS